MARAAAIENPLLTHLQSGAVGGGLDIVGRSCVTERKARELKLQRGDAPGHEAKEIFTREGAALLLPMSEADALKEVRVRDNDRDVLGFRAN